MEKSIITNTTGDRKALAESTSAIVNKKRPSSDAIEPNTKKPKKQGGFDLSTATPPSFMEDIILPDEDDCGMGIYESCNDIRRKIRALLASGVKVTHFLNWVDVNSNSYGRFMSYKKPYQGVDNSLYEAAYKSHVEDHLMVDTFSLRRRGLRKENQKVLPGCSSKDLVVGSPPESICMRFKAKKRNALRTGREGSF